MSERDLNKLDDSRPSPSSSPTHDQGWSNTPNLSGASGEEGESGSRTSKTHAQTTAEKLDSAEKLIAGGQECAGSSLLMPSNYTNFVQSLKAIQELNEQKRLSDPSHQPIQVSEGKTWVVFGEERVVLSNKGQYPAAFFNQNGEVVSRPAGCLDGNN